VTGKVVYFSGGERQLYLPLKQEGLPRPAALARERTRSCLIWVQWALSTTAGRPPVELVNKPWQRLASRGRISARFKNLRDRLLYQAMGEAMLELIKQAN
jgi:hypothetical protein